MKYMGGKVRHAKEIIATVLSLSPEKTKWIEPFVGGGSVITSVPKRLAIFGSDINVNVIELFKHVQNGGSLPDEVTKEKYLQVKANPKDFDAWFVGFVSIGCSFGGKEWGGFGQGLNSKGNPRNYALETKNKLLSMDFKGISFNTLDFREVNYDKDCIIYCDPPYSGTTGYKNKFYSGLFWEWAAKCAEEASVYVSEYSAPEGWECVWEKTTPSASLAVKNSAGRKATEKLFRFAR